MRMNDHNFDLSYYLHCIKIEKNMQIITAPNDFLCATDPHDDVV